MNVITCRISNLFAVALLLGGPLNAAEVSGKVTLTKDNKPINPVNTLVGLDALDPAVLTPREPRTYEIDMKDKTFVPGHLVVRTGDVVIFPNSDHFKHNVFSTTEGFTFDLGSYGPGEKPGQAFTNTGVAQIYCNVHQQMASFVMVTEGDWGQVTEKDGAFLFKDVPPGKYRLRAWNLRGESSQEITVSPEGVADALLEIDGSTFRPTPHKNKHGKDYPRTFSDDESY